MPNWLVVSHIFYFHPNLGKIPILTSIFFRWVGSTTNQPKSRVDFLLRKNHPKNTLGKTPPNPIQKAADPAVPGTRNKKVGRDGTETADAKGKWDEMRLGCVFLLADFLINDLTCDLLADFLLVTQR